MRQLQAQDRHSEKAHGTRPRAGMKLLPPALVATGAALLSKGTPLVNTAFLGSAVPERPSCIVPATVRHRFGTSAKRQAGRFCDMDGTVPENEFLARRGRKSLIMRRTCGGMSCTMPSRAPPRSKPTNGWNGKAVRQRGQENLRESRHLASC